MGQVTAARDRDVEIAIVISVALHVILLFMLAWQVGAGLAERWASAQERKAVVEEVTMLYPDQIFEIIPPPPPVPKAEPEQYIRTTQNSSESEAPERADFVSDRNTKAASEQPAAADGTGPLPTQDGLDRPTLELADRDYKDGEIKEDGATPVPVSPPAMADNTPAPSPPSVMKPAPAASPPPPALPPMMEMAKNEVASPLEQMLDEADASDLARVTLNRLPLDVRQAEVVDAPAMVEPPDLALTPPTPDQPPAPATPPQPPDEVPKAIPVPDPVSRTAGKPDEEAFSPFTRASKARGTISNRGEAAVNAAETPVGRYMRQVTGAVEKRWHILRRRNADAVTFGSLRLRFYVTPTGRVEPPSILSDRREADARMIDFTLQAILEAEIPPIPEDLLPLLDRQRLEVEYDVLIY